MKLTCPKDPEHKTFSVGVMVIEDWVLDENGKCLDVKGRDIDTPNEGYIYTCIECQTIAKVEP